MTARARAIYTRDDRDRDTLHTDPRDVSACVYLSVYSRRGGRYMRVSNVL